MWYSLFVKRVSYLQAKQYELCVYTWYLAKVRNSVTFSHMNSRSTGEKRARKKRRDIGRKSLTRQSRHVSMPLGGCSRHVVSPTLCPFSTFRTAPALPGIHTHTPIPISEFPYLCRSCFLFVHLYIPLPIRARFTRCKEWFPPGPRVDCGRSVYPCYKY